MPRLCLSINNSMNVYDSNRNHEVVHIGTSSYIKGIQNIKLELYIFVSFKQYTVLKTDNMYTVKSSNYNS